MMRALTIAAAVVLNAAALAAQQPQAVVVPSTINVGDVFHAAIRVELPAGAELEVPDSLPVGGDIEQAGRRTIRVDSADGSRHVTVAYPLTAWRPGRHDLPEVRVRIVGAGVLLDSATSLRASNVSMSVTLPSFEVASVLPADTAGIEPRAARDVLGANRLWWLILLALIVVAAIITALIVWWRRRHRREEPPAITTPAVPPREAALAQLDALRREGLIERGELREFYERLTEVLRHYAAAMDARWSVDLTTSELAVMLRRDIELTDALEFTRILAAADMVKFARAVTTRDIATNDLDAARTWVDRFALPVEEPVAAGADDARAA